MTVTQRATVNIHKGLFHHPVNESQKQGHGSAWGKGTGETCPSGDSTYLWRTVWKRKQANKPFLLSMTSWPSETDETFLLNTYHNALLIVGLIIWRNKSHKCGGQCWRTHKSTKVCAEFGSLALIWRGLSEPLSRWRHQGYEDWRVWRLTSRVSVLFRGCLRKLISCAMPSDICEHGWTWIVNPPSNQQNEEWWCHYLSLTPLWCNGLKTPRLLGRKKATQGSPGLNIIKPSAMTLWKPRDVWNALSLAVEQLAGKPLKDKTSLCIGHCENF